MGRSCGRSWLNPGEGEIMCKGKGKVVPVLNLIKHYAMKVFGGVVV
jgi:hypothetical protein